MSELLPPNSTRTERNLANVAARISDIPSPITRLMNPDTIPADLLPWLAWHMGIDAWKDYWSEQTKRARVKSAIAIARKKGTAAAVREVVATFGGNIALREWFEMTPPGVPGTFDIVMTVSARDGVPATAAYVADIIAEIDRTKPVRAHYTFTQGFGMQGKTAFAAAVRPALYCRLSLSDK
ncbi:phage tail protein I [Paraburkholderia sediminicola]|uniref:phage tail protein I n=1 Tax=Paraburkholderia sediminicola TaxID=458836 RepID=UPI0038B890F6